MGSGMKEFLLLAVLTSSAFAQPQTTIQVSAKLEYRCSIEIKDNRVKPCNNPNLSSSILKVEESKATITVDDKYITIKY
jgi:hypothetical protein